MVDFDVHLVQPWFGKIPERFLFNSLTFLHSKSNCWGCWIYRSKYSQIFCDFLEANWLRLRLKTVFGTVFMEFDYLWYWRRWLDFGVCRIWLFICFAAQKIGNYVQFGIIFDVTVIVVLWQRFVFKRLRYEGLKIGHATRFLSQHVSIGFCHGIVRFMVRIQWIAGKSLRIEGIKSWRIFESLVVYSDLDLPDYSVEMVALILWQRLVIKSLKIEDLKRWKIIIEDLLKNLEISEVSGSCSSSVVSRAVTMVMG